MIVHMKQTLVLSLGGSVICSETFNRSLLKKYTTVLKSIIQTYHCRIILVIGGGTTAREYVQTARKMGICEDDALDALGIRATQLNAELVRSLFSELSYKEVCTDPTQRIQTTKPLLVSGGWKPGFSTDNVAVEWAKTYGAKQVINLTNVDYVYTKDPRKHKDAKKCVDLDWDSFSSLMGTARVPSGNWPFDPVAAKEAKKRDITAVVCNGNKIARVKKLLASVVDKKQESKNKKKEWTTITPS
jgi:uridylate kinase